MIRIRDDGLQEELDYLPRNHTPVLARIEPANALTKPSAHPLHSDDGQAVESETALPTQYSPPDPGSSSGSSQYFGIDIIWKFTNRTAAFECFSL